MDAQVCNSSCASHPREDEEDMRKGPWTVEEDSILTQYITIHGEGRWNAAARCAGLKRTGKSCRLRWLNYLRPEVRRGNITLQEQLLILELHSRWGNRWSKIAQHLPGRTDNEIKNYWRTRVQKQAKQLKCDVNSKQFRDAMRGVWIPRLIERIQASSQSSSMGHQPVYGASSAYSGCFINTNPTDAPAINQPARFDELGSSEWVDPNFLPELSDSFDTQVSPASDLTTDCQNPPCGYYSDSARNGSWGWYSDMAGMEQEGSNDLLGGVESLEQMWNDESILFLQQELM